MKMIIGKKFEFEAAHNLPADEIYGECSHLHGHRYQLEVEVCGEVNEYGWVCNYKDLKAIVKECILNKYDHAYLNEFFDVPTAENMVIDMVKQLTVKFEDKPYKLHKVLLRETSSSFAEITIGE